MSSGEGEQVKHGCVERMPCKGESGMLMSWLSPWRKFSWGERDTEIDRQIDAVKVAVILCTLVFLMLYKFPLPGCPVLPYLQLLIVLRCIATGSHQVTIGDCHDVSQATISHCLKTVSRAIGSRSQHYIVSPADNDLRRMVQQFREIAGMPGVVGSIDCTQFNSINFDACS